MGGGWWFYGGVFFCRGIGAFSLCFIGGRQVPLRRGLGRGPSGSQSCVLKLHAPVSYVCRGRDT